MELITLLTEKASLDLVLANFILSNTDNGRGVVLQSLIRRQNEINKKLLRVMPEEFERCPQISIENLIISNGDHNDISIQGE